MGFSSQLLGCILAVAAKIFKLKVVFCVLSVQVLSPAVILFRHTLFTDKPFCPSQGLVLLTERSANAAWEPEFDSLGIKSLWELGLFSCS